jgi:hypothetical protein
MTPMQDYQDMTAEQLWAFFVCNWRFRIFGLVFSLPSQALSMVSRSKARRRNFQKCEP